MKRRLSAYAGIPILLIAVVLTVWAGTTGYLRGKITDLTTGEELIGVNVLIVGSGRGAVTNENGEYSVSGVPAGEYTIRASLIGYQPIEAKKVVIDADETTVYNFKLASTLIEAEGVTVEGQRPLVDVKKTAGDQTYNRDKIDQIPNIKNVSDVLGLQAGVVKFGNQMFLRGGRANETQIIVDGVPVNDVSGVSGTAGTSTANEQLQQLYSGTGVGGGGGALSVPANAIQSVSVSSSGLDAEYGNAQSGVVNITTRSGSQEYSGSGQYRSDGIGGGGFGDRYYAMDLGGAEPLTMHLLPALGVEVPGKMSFFLSGTFSQSDGPYSYNTSHFFNPLQRKVRFGGFMGKILNDVGFTYTDKQRNDFSFNGKLSYSIGESDQFHYRYTANASSSHPLSGGYSWRDRYDSTTTSISLSDQNVLQWIHVIGTNTILRGHVSRLLNEGTTSVANLTPAQYSVILDPDDRDPNEDGFIDIGTAQNWSTSRSLIWNTKFDYSSQVHQYHFLKAGIDLNFEHITSTSISFPNDPSRDIDSSSGGAYPGYGLARWVADNKPIRGALYVQDNIELTGLNIHVGLRYDFLYLGKEVSDPAFVNAWESLLGERADWVDYDATFSSFAERSFLKQATSGNVSPRLSIGYPVSTRTVFYFNYGHFLQYPDRDQYFHPPVLTSLSGNYVGNPSLKPQKTVQYEAGFDQLIFDDLSLGIRGFYKDIFDYASFRRTTVDKYVNLDYASARGFEVIVTKQLTDRYSGSLGYTFQLAKGRSSDPRAAQASPQLFGLPREVRLDWDQQHTVSMFAGYRVGPNEDYRVFGLLLNNWGASVTWSYGSGFPYTPYNPGRSLADLYLKNTGDGPYTSEINLSLFKGFTVLDKLNIMLTLDVVNLLNRRNIDMNAGGFNTLLGRPIVYGDYTPDTQLIYTWSGKVRDQSFGSRVPPFIFRSPRQVSLGMKLTWN